MVCLCRELALSGTQGRTAGTSHDMGTSHISCRVKEVGARSRNVWDVICAMPCRRPRDGHGKLTSDGRGPVEGLRDVGSGAVSHDVVVVVGAAPHVFPGICGVG